jgi:hypothetical protein
VLLVVAGLVHAATTGSLAGIVRDSDGEPLAGATVQITSDSLIGGPRVAVSGPDGRFAFHLLQVGIYTVEANLHGFVTAPGDVRVRANHVGSIAFQLAPDTFSGEIEVTADAPVVDVTQVNTGVVLDEDYLSKALVGTANRSYHRILGHFPGVGSQPWINEENTNADLNVLGSTRGENAYLVDGMNTADPRNGTWTVHFNIDAVQELALQIGGFEAEFGQATGGIVNLVTKSGGNDFRGTVDARYRADSFTESGEHYDPNERNEHLYQIAATLGGPILRDRLWFFTSAQYIDDAVRSFDAHFGRQYQGAQLLAKGTWQASGSTRASLMLSTDPVEITGFNMGRDVLESAMATRELGGNLYQLEVNSVLSDAWLLTAHIGANSTVVNAFPTSGSETVSGHHNVDNRLYYHNAPWSTEYPRSRREARISATWFVNDILGNHEFKGGLGYSRLGYEETYFLNGGGSVTDFSPSSPGWEPIDLNGDGYFNQSVTVLEPAELVGNTVRSSGDIMTAFVQDAWRPVPRLVVKPGLRFDRVTLDNSVGERVADMSVWQPRFGVAWDLLGTARHVIRASAGRFMDPTTLRIPELASGVPGLVSHGYNTLEYYCNLTGGLFCDEDSLPPSYGDPIHWTNWDGQQYTLFDTAGIPPQELASKTVDQLGVGRLRAPYVDELILAYETQIASETSLELSYVNRSTNDIIDDTCANNEWAWGAAPPPSYDDSSTWTTVDGCNSWVVANVPGLRRSYEAWILRVEARRSWGHLMASYTYAENLWTAASGPADYITYDGDLFPAGFYNRWGSVDRPHRVRLNGYLLLPARFTVALDGIWSAPEHSGVVVWCTDLITGEDRHRRSEIDQLNGVDFDPSVPSYCVPPDVEGPLLGQRLVLEGWGSRESPALWRFDLQLAKSFRIRQVDLQAIFSVYNLFGSEQATSVNFWALNPRLDDDGEIVRYQNVDPSAPYYDEYYGADDSPVLIPIGEPWRYQRPRRYEIGFRIEF